MKIGIDASQFQSPEPTGVEWYSHYLISHIIPLLGRDHHFEVRLYTSKNFTTDIEFPFNVSKKKLPFQKLSSRIRINWELLFHPVDIYFSPTGTLPFFAPRKTIVTIQDLAFEHIKFSSRKNFWEFFQKWRHKKYIRRIIKKAHKILTPSEAVKTDLEKIYHCPSKKIIVIPFGSSEVSPLLNWSLEETKALRQQFRLNERDLFMLFVGKLETKKNLVRLMEAFKRFLVEFPDWKLILAGKRGQGFEEIWQKVVELQL
jgi:glycosyltransferase involved in cell wall biosynthesis